MAKVDNIKTFQKEDFDPQNAKLIETLAYAINPFMEQISRAFQKQIDITNLTDLIVDIVVTVDTDGIPLMPTAMKVNDNPNNTRKVLGMAVIRAENLTDSDPVLSQPFLDFSINKDLASVTHIAGLPSDKKFKLTVRIYK